MSSPSEDGPASRATPRRRPLPSIEDIAAAHHDRDQIILVTKDFLLNQLRRDAPTIANSFDECLGKELDKISELFGNIYGILAPRIVGTDLVEKDLTSTCARLLYGAGTTLAGSIYLARGGFRRQYMVLIRSVIETVAVVIRICVDPNALSEFYAGRLDSKKAINPANKVFPGFGKIYGMLSKHFVHIGEGHSAFDGIGTYKKDDIELKVIVTNMKLTTWVLYVATELVFIEFLPHPRYWKIVARHEGDRNEIEYAPSADERHWQTQFLGADQPEWTPAVKTLSPE